ncbi:MAG: NAD(P)H-hydrate dehydratase [Pseudomonadota bacterium]|nr:NAD(P)H-hydrate dehydratase [Pseudomonadota bacterium]
MTEPRPLTIDELKRHPLPPARQEDKYGHGQLLLVAGSRQTPGSAVITATAAQRAGCGKVTIATSADVAPHIALAAAEARVLWLAEGRRGGLARSALRELDEHVELADCVVAGPGIAKGPQCGALARRLLADRPRALVFDAAILLELEPHAELCREAGPILLPHDKEMAALIGCDEDEAEREPLRCGRECASHYGALVLVKGPISRIVSPDDRTWEYAGCEPGLGVAGSGDVLAGIVGGLAARGADPLTALLWAIWLHGEAGSALAKKIGPIGYLAREISAEIPALLDRAQPSLE